MRHNRWIKKIASVVLTSSLLMPNIAVAEANLLPKQAASRAADESATTKNWLSAYQAALQAGAGAKEKQPDEQPTYTKAEVMKLEWGPLSAESVWQLYQTADRKLLQLAAYVHPQLDQFLSHNEQVDKYQWLDEAFQKKMDGLTAAEKKQLAAYAPQVVALYEKGKEVAAAKKALSPAGKAKATESAAPATQTASALANIPDAMFETEGLTYKYQRTNTDNPVDELYRAANVQEVDVQLEGKHGMDLTVERRYSSLDAMTERIYFSTSGKNKTAPLQGNNDGLPEGWSFNFPQFREVSKENAKCTFRSDDSKYTCGSVSEGKRYIFTLEDGTILESSSIKGEWVNTPYKPNAGMGSYRKPSGEFGEKHIVTLSVDGNTYEFGEDHKYRNDELYRIFLVKKTNAYGDTIRYRIPEDYRDAIRITDSVGRLIVMERGGGVVLKVYQDASETKLLKHLEYDSDYAANKDRVVEHSVTGGESKVIAEYSYLDPKTYGKAEFDLHAGYSFPAPNGVIDFNDGGLESTAYTNLDKERRSTVEYKLLKQVNYPVEGLSMTYTYSLYQPDAPGFLDRGVTRIYHDKEALTYTSYLPVTAVNFRFAKAPHPDQPATEWYSYTKYYPHITKEIWKSPKAQSVRFAKQSLARDGALVVSRTLQDGLPSEDKNYTPNQDRNFVLQSVKHYVGSGADNETIQGELALTEDGKTYRYAPASYTSYLYRGRDTKPAYVYSFMGRPASMTADADIYAFLLAPNPDRLDKVQARLGRYALISEYSYNSHGEVTKEVDPKGNVTLREYVQPIWQSGLRVPASIKKTAADNPNHFHEETYTYTDKGLLATEKIVDSYPDGAGPKVVQTDRTYTYNDKKQLTSVTEASTGPDAKTVTQKITAYEPMGLYPADMSLEVEVATGQKQSLYHVFVYDGLGRLTARAYPDNTVVQYEYDLLGRRTKESVTSKQQTRTTTYAYDDSARKVTMTLPDSTKLVTQFTPYGEVEYKAQLGTDGTVRPLLYNTYSLDGNHLLSSAPYADNNRATTYVYNADGSVWQKKDPVGTTVYLTANTVNDGTSYAPALTRLTLAPNGLQAVQYHDRYGQLEKEVQRAGDGVQSMTTKLVRNAFDQVTKKTETDQTGKSRTWEYRYTNDGNITNLLDPEQNRYQYEYDALGNLVTVTENQVLTTRNHYNALSWKLSEQDVPSGATESSAYNANGTLNAFTDKAGNRHVYGYTPFYDLASIMTRNASGTLMNLETKDYVPNTSLVQKETNSNGSSVLPTAANYREITYSYDAFQRLKSQTVFGRTYQMGYTDRDDLMDSLTYPDGTAIAYRYDHAGRLIEVNSGLTGKIEYAYVVDNTGEQIKAAYPNGRSNKRKIDSFGQVQTVVHEKNQAAVWNEASQYSFGNVVSIQRNGTTLQYEYDKIDRLTKEVAPGTTNQYSYDGRGNRSAFAGTLPTESGSFTYTFDERNRLRGVLNETTGETSAYTYYSDGLRATKTENGAQTKYVYLSGRVIEELDATNALKARNVWGNELLFRQDAAAGKKGYYHYNSHGDVVAISDATGQELNTYTYDTWGNLTAKTEAMSNPYQYSGEMYEEKTGFYYLRARYYDPKVGRFVSEDTYKGAVDNPLSLNRYTYVHNNPINNIDPTGNYCVSVDGKNAHGGGCNNSTSKYLGDDITGDPIISNGKLTGYIGISGPGTLEGTNYWDSYGYVPGLGSIRFGKEFDMGVKGWSVRFDKGMAGTATQDHAHVFGPKGQEWSQNTDGSPHDQNRNSPGDPPNSMKKELKKKFGWDWDAKAKAYNDSQKFSVYDGESGLRFSSYTELDAYRMGYTVPVLTPSGQVLEMTSPNIRMSPGVRVRFVIP
ncbi:RHS repeat-associated core domain-containing protein [Brevibacillus parabrevis]|uniref:RHS repeat domain-containing protein n=1 Tax=Brevibacillus parabrevis TaxID=54914 RepID=UPI0028D5F87B|nr:RHS repeat-associated core domain-containing protein [Brevibacillus parabrevis]